MPNTARLGLPLIEAAQAQKHVTHNEALAALDQLVQTLAESRSLAAPPSSPADGQAWIVAAAPTGAWAGKADQIAAWQSGAWTFYAARTGMLAWVKADNRLFVWTGSAWADLVATLASTLQNLSLLGIGTTADANNPLAAKVNKALFAAKSTGEGGTGDLRVTFNKDAASNVLSLLFQTGYSGRAEFGLAGSNDMVLKTSADGSAWTDAMKVTAGTGELVTQALRPASDNARALGSASFRWSQIFAATATISTSDAREKTDVGEDVPGLSFLRRLRPVAFRWRVAEAPATPNAMPRAGRRRHVGLIAQEVKAALGESDLALWTRDAESGREGLRYEEFVPVLIRAVQDLDRRLDEALGRAFPDRMDTSDR